MCGIAGWLNLHSDISKKKILVEKMSATLARRGPDQAGIWVSESAVLAHRRLIVVDPAGGCQPMVRKRGNQTYILVYNGELYNTTELRDDLVGLGYRFQGHSDTEVLLASYMEWGAGCVERFNGIFAFAVWDVLQQSLFLARDRFGVKPLFYTLCGDSFLFSSELKALLAHPLVKPELDSEGLAEIFALGPSHSPGHGIFKNIREVKAGHSLIYNCNGIQTRRYWQLVSAEHPDDLAVTIIKVRQLLHDAAYRQLVADVPVCTLLSGGLDSSALTAIAANSLHSQSQEPLHTFSVDYADNDRHFQATQFEPTTDEPWVKLISECFGTHHHFIKIDTPQLTDALIDAMRARDLPGMADIDSSLYLFCKEIKKFATVAQSGECADEVFGGYPWYMQEESLTCGTFPWLRSIEQRKQVLSSELVNYIQPDDYIARRYSETIAEVPQLPGENPLEARRRELFYLNLTWFMPQLLERKDRMSMAAGLEVRVPFCDHRLVEYVWNIPWHMKSCGNREKGILREALHGILPKEVLNRKKSPYPKTHNPAYLSAVTRQLREIIHDPASPLLPLINKETVLKITRAESDIFDKPWFGQLMKGPQLFAFLIQVDTWLREYKISIN
ncbi:MAG: asparagine synthase (glutamine-hydrolyzing) [Thermincola sp.]|jgi:asparagine synthase (glutamine-hydrolysing)|nr:asparagine synthase (glutamine-hydrolyzing) [Thermincola sp.]MDT3702215.1 asparagine synthase (glutamine-hydrolyzing) [Thermincola sp.]